MSQETEQSQTGAPRQAAISRPPIGVAEADEDAGLVRRCREGDVEAFGALVTRHEARVGALIGRFLGTTATPEDVEDAAQDVFVQAWRALPRFRGDARFSTWLYRIATNTAIRQWHRRKRHRQMIADEDAATEAVSPTRLSEDIARRAEGRALRAAVDGLPEKQRTVVLLHYFEDCSCEEIALLLGCSVGTVWSRLHYGCRKLRDQLRWLEQP
ncbi:MAG: sigma-70 family RNA polymerase sigma factor [Armatimonadetes bacterium]|nr:sigma-70 family RNA polymerase sigma factor [Armatimonadota bacterium]